MAQKVVSDTQKVVSDTQKGVSDTQKHADREWCERGTEFKSAESRA